MPKQNVYKQHGLLGKYQVQYSIIVSALVVVRQKQSGLAATELVDVQHTEYMHVRASSSKEGMSRHVKARQRYASGGGKYAAGGCRMKTSPVMITGIDSFAKPNMNFVAEGYRCNYFFPCSLF